MHQVEGIKELRLKRAGPFMVGVFEVAVDGGMTGRKDACGRYRAGEFRNRIVGLSLTVKVSRQPGESLILNIRFDPEKCSGNL